MQPSRSGEACRRVFGGTSSRAAPDRKTFLTARAMSRTSSRNKNAANRGPGLRWRPRARRRIQPGCLHSGSYSVPQISPFLRKHVGPSAAFGYLAAMLIGARKRHKVQQLPLQRSRRRLLPRLKTHVNNLLREIFLTSFALREARAHLSNRGQS